ncbi:MAG: translation initiation factor IF-2 [Candidatus Omnitrophota bacterium]|nr:translation initiation factor IF-2 [Candidatus Omnitrophota bacterium]
MPSKNIKIKSVVPKEETARLEDKKDKTKKAAVKKTSLKPSKIALKPKKAKEVKIQKTLKGPLVKKTVPVSRKPKKEESGSTLIPRVRPEARVITAKPQEVIPKPAGITQESKITPEAQKSVPWTAAHPPVKEKKVEPIKEISSQEQVRTETTAQKKELPLGPQGKVVPVIPAKETPPPPPEKEEIPEKAKIIEINIPIVLKDLALCLEEKPAALIKKLLLGHKIIANLNLPIGEELAGKIASEYGYQIKRKPTEEELLFKPHEASDPAKLKPRPPIVTFMGHVDHGKTSLLDAIRKSKVADSEYGGITQHIGAYSVTLSHGKITFLDTPGHEAFTAMRARGAKVTDIVVLVVAADDGVMPQTVEAVDHAKEAKAAIMVAMNKIDKPQTDVNRLKKQLAELGLAAEDWGGKTIAVGVSAKTGQGIDELLEMIILEAQMLELKADPSAPASGVVLESKISEGKGPVATLLVENGTLRYQDTIIVGPHFAKIRAMFNEYGKPIQEAPPSTPVEILGLSGLPESGEQFFVLSDEKKARELAGKRKAELRERQLKPIKMKSLEDFSKEIKEGKVKELKLILKSDVGGSLEAINESLKKIFTLEVNLNIIHQGIGGINVADVILAEASGAIILGFHVATDERSKAEADKTGVDIRTYTVIYELVNDIKTALEGLLEPKLKKIFMGRVIIRQVLKLSKAGTVAGCYVEKGKVNRSAKLSLLRNGELVYEGTVQSLKRFKDDVREVTEGMECGLSLAGFSEIMAGDVIEAYDVEKIARKL